jgi:hypothetical protein
MRLIELLVFMFLFVGCATKFILPGNRFMTPETQGGIFKVQADYQLTQGNQLLVKPTSSLAIDEGVNNSQIYRSAYFLGTSLFQSFDLYWSHIGAGNSLFGLKWQILGTSREAKGAGHKLALSYAFGGNQHEEDTLPGVKFNLSGQELMLLYGYRISDWFLPYSSLTYSIYDLEGTVRSSSMALNGRKLDYQSTLMGAYVGAEFLLMSLVLKIEYGYQQLAVSKSPEFTQAVYGYSIGYIW